MQLIYFIGFVVYFIGCQYLVEKEKIPKEIMDCSALKLILGGILIIVLSMVMGVLLSIAVPLVVAMTMLVASIIAGKYRKVFNEMERGGKI